MNDGGYEIEDCERMIERCEANVKTFREGIEREEESIKHFTAVRDNLIAKAETETDGVPI